MQYEDASTIAKIYDKEKSVVSDLKKNLNSISKNYMKWFAEYNVIIQKIVIRDKNKKRKDALNDKYEVLIQERFQ